MRAYYFLFAWIALAAGFKNRVIFFALLLIVTACGAEQEKEFASDYLKEGIDFRIEKDWESDAQEAFWTEKGFHITGGLARDKYIDHLGRFSSSVFGSWNWFSILACAMALPQIKKQSSAKKDSDV